jgi:hypothetical protein
MLLLDDVQLMLQHLLLLILIMLVLLAGLAKVEVVIVMWVVALKYLLDIVDGMWWGWS